MDVISRMGEWLLCKLTVSDTVCELFI